jgi:hypothetical protein
MALASMSVRDVMPILEMIDKSAPALTEENLATLFARFWRRYVEGSGDRELADVVAPFFAFRWLVANPVWYPNLSPAVRGTVLTLVRAALDAPRFDPLRVNDYCEATGSFEW